MSEAAADASLTCPVNTVLDIIAGKWKPSILCELRHGARRFSDLRREIPGVSEKVLTAHLRDLEADAIVSRRQFNEGAMLATEYAFTEYGRTLIPALNALAEWGLRRQAAAR